MRSTAAHRYRHGVTPLALGAAMLWAALVCIWEGLNQPGHTETLCWFHTITGVPCPTCGSTRAVFSLVHGDVAAALAHNPLLVLLMMMGLIGLFVRAITGVWPKMISNVLSDRKLAMIVLGALAMNWMYLIVHELM
jgi:hypothetical protein